ncbi:MAG: NAD(P)-dependent alcohol dehydrogenase [Pseudomonadota bacterium]|nr:NAD(P)-dependent alcohol dehydrogenase [Pseudomonadota bacterium]
MRVVEIGNAFGLENLNLGEREPADPGPGEVTVRIHAASLNYRDLMMVRGLYNPRQKLPLIPCSDGAGEVVAVGDGVSRFRKGDRVAGIFAQKWLAGPGDSKVARFTLGGPLDGTLAEQMNFHEDGLVSIPDHLTFDQAATLPCAAVTAWHALVAHGQIKAGDSVLVLGTGGVSLFALQLAQASGARVVVTSSQDDKLERARRLGAWQTINYRTTPDWPKQVYELTNGEGVDHVVEVGGAGTLSKSVDAAGIGGRVSVIGVLSGTAAEIDVRRLLMRGIQLRGVFVGSRSMFEDMNRAISQHRIEPVVDNVFPLEDTREAFEHMAQGRHFGKIVIRVS